MMKLTTLFISMILISSCLKKGSKNLADNQPPQDITISLLKVSPPSVILGPGESTQFEAVGGNAPYTFEVSAGFGGIDNEGVYTASSSHLGANQIKVTDAGGNSVYAIATVGNSLQISPTSKTMGTDASTNFSAIGGMAPFSYSIIQGDGSISSSGVYTSGSSPGNASIRVTDAEGSSAVATVSIVNALTVSPTTLTLEDLASYTLDVAGGVPPYSYSVYAGSGSIDANGVYTASASAGNEIVKITDSNNEEVEVQISVVLGPDLIVPDDQLAPHQQITLSSSVGTAPFVYTLENGSGSVNSSTGEFSAPAIADLSTIRITDANGFFDEKNIQTYNLKKLALGDNFTCMLQVHNDNATSDYKCWGIRTSGQLGDESSHIGDAAGEMGDNLPYIDLGTISPVIGLYSSPIYHRCALFANNKVKCWGSGGQGRTGNGNQTTRGNYANEMGFNLPYISLPSGETVSSDLPINQRLNLGYDGSCVLVDNQTVRCFGEGRYGRHGYGNETDYCDRASNCGNNLPALNLGGGKTIVQMAKGYEFSCALIAPDNKVKCWGRNNYGQLGIGNTSNQIVTPAAAAWVDLGSGRTVQQIAAGYYHTCALLDDDTIKCWGYNNHGELGIGNRATQGNEPGEMGDNLQIADMGTVSYPVSIQAEGHSNCAIFNNGGLKCWGRNSYGNLGIGSTAHFGDNAGEMGDNLPFVSLGSSETVTDVDLSEYHTCVITSSQNLKCFGYNEFGQLGIGNTIRIGDSFSEMGNNLASVDLGSGLYATKVSTNRYSTCALLNNDKVKCWGYNEGGSMGTAHWGYGDEAGETVASLSNIDLGAGNYAKDIFSGRSHSCALLFDNSLKCFGDNDQGKLGIGNNIDVGDNADEMGDNLATTNLGAGLHATRVSLYERSSCAILNTGDVKCWGDGANGRRGSGDQHDRGDQANEMGDNLASVFLDPSGGVTATEITKGNAFTCIITNEGKVKCWGRNTNGQLGLESTAQKGHSSSTAPHLYGYTNLGTGRTAKKISAGHEFMCAILDNDKVKCWGYNNHGELGQGDRAYRGNEAGEMGDNLPYVDLGSGRTALMIDTGHYHACALLDNHEIKCWGRGSYGNLGNASSAHRGDTAGETGDNNPNVVLGSNDKPLAIYAAGNHSCAVLETNEVKCWGYNNAGQLGHGHRYNVGTDYLSLGDNLPVTE